MYFYKGEEMVFGFKCFDKGLVNSYGVKFEEGKIYETCGEIKFGLWGNGYHMCKNIEDTLRYFDGMNMDVDICSVLGMGNIDIYNDDYNGYYDMYSVEKIKIIKLLTRDEIIDMVLSLNEFRVMRFLQGYRLDDSEIALFLDKFNNNMNVCDVISYYQYGDKEVYSRRYKK